MALQTCRVAFNRTVLVGLTLWLSGLAGPTAAAATRIAIVASQNSAARGPSTGTNEAGAVGGVIALAEAKLSTCEGLEVLDRLQIERVLKEQKLSLSGLVDASQAVKVGQILSVDLFVIVEKTADGKEAFGCLIYDANSGLRLWDAALSSDGIEATVDGVVAGVDAAVRKRVAGPQMLRTMSIVGVRNADLPRSVDTVCESLGMLLERELARSGNVGVLERKGEGANGESTSLSKISAAREDFDC